MKRVFTVLLVFVLTLGLFSAHVAAAEPPKSAAELLNAAVLSPQKTGNPALDAKVEALLAGFRATAKDTYSLVKACYDYLIDFMRYEQNTPVRVLDIYMQSNGSFPLYVMHGAEYALNNGYGVCDDYTAAFVVMTRAIGLEAFNMGGQTRTTSGGFTGHAWAEICVNSVFYVFDAQLEDNVAKDGEVRYIYFCKTQAEMAERYKWDTESNASTVAGYRAAADSLPKPAPTPIFTPAPDVRVLYNGVEIPFDTTPMLEGSRVLVPMRAIFETLGATVTWDGEMQLVTAFYGEHIIAMFANEPEAFVAGEIVLMDVPPRIVNSRTLVPVRFIATALQKTIVWDGATKTVLITD